MRTIDRDIMIHRFNDLHRSLAAIEDTWNEFNDPLKYDEYRALKIYDVVDDEILPIIYMPIDDENM